MHIRLVPKKIWESITDSRFQMLSIDTRRAASSILRTMHNRHIGITPDLAAQLASFILGPTVSFQPEDPWGHVLKRLTEELGGGHLGFGVLPNAVPPYSVMRLAMPIVEQACRRIGLCCLFCEDETGTMLTQGYRQYSRRLSIEIEQMTGEKDDFFQIFWKERALTLAGYSRRPTAWNTEREPGFAGGGLPETDPAASGLLLRLRPRVTPPKPLSRSSKPMTSPMRHRESPRTREGGFSGVWVTRRPEDMDHMLISEYLNPPLLLADRLVNSGYLALKRKPKHERLRDVLIVGLMPHEVKPKLNADFIKACWFDFINRFGLMLAHHKLMRSEFQWLEGDTFGRYRHCNFHLEDLPEPGPVTDVEPTPAHRRGFMVTLGWFPSFLDNRSGFETLPGTPGSTRETDPLMRWAYAAWKQQKLRQRRKDRQWDVEEFAYVHIMVFLPAVKHAEQGAADVPPHIRLRQMHRGFGFGSMDGGGAASGRSISITRVPKVLEDTPLLFPGQQTQQKQLTWEEIAGQLVREWLQQAIEEIGNA